MITTQKRVDEAAQILLVDDEPLVCDLLRKMLERGGYEILSAGNGRDALDLCRRSVRPVRLLVTDLQMPEMSGYELAERCSLLYPSMSILFVSGSGPAEPMQAKLQGPNRAFLSKPVELEDLLCFAKALLTGPREDRLPRRRAPSSQSGRALHGDYLQA